MASRVNGNRLMNCMMCAMMVGKGVVMSCVLWGLRLKGMSQYAQFGITSGPRPHDIKRGLGARGISWYGQSAGLPKTAKWLEAALKFS
jgi:hypothetical protein